jgi:hypothetical protein
MGGEKESVSMNAECVRALEAIAYALITAMGMAQENQMRAQKGLAQAYPDTEFFGVAESMRGQVQDLASWIK